MAETGEKASRFRLAPHSKKNKKAKESVEKEGEVQQTIIYPTRILMTADDPSTGKTYQPTYNPIPKTKTLLLTMANLDPGLSITTLDGKRHLTIHKDTFPTSEEKFRQYFTCVWEQAHPKQKAKVRLGVTINGNRTLNSMKHKEKPSPFLQWLNQNKVYIEADALGISQTKTVGYLTGLHPRFTNQTFAKDKLYDLLNNTIIEFEDAQKIDSSLAQTMSDNKTPTVHCPVFELFQTTIGTGTKPRIETDVIGIKCHHGRSALLHEFLIQNKEKIEQEGQGKFIPAGLTKVVGTGTMQQIIRTNNQFLRNMVSIPINRISPVALKAKIVLDDTKPEEDQTKMTAYDYITSAEWCQGLEPTDREGRYLRLTTQQDVKEARAWLDDNLEELFTEYIPQYQTFTPIEGYDYPKRGDKP